MNETTSKPWTRSLGTGVLALAALLATSTCGAAEAGWRAGVRKFAAEHFHHPAWGYTHSLRDYKLATTLAREDGVALDDDVLYAAAMLHDMAAFAPWDREKDGIDHADEGAHVAAKVLADAGFPRQKLPAVQGAIITHMFDREPKGPEALYLHDADALDWLGAIGAARILALIDPNGGQPDGPKAVKMLDENLAAVPGRVLSPAGQKRRPALEAELRTFLKALRHETDDLKRL
jgi:hypothetical protein